ncbi:chemotaxis protein [Desulfosporosinus sp. HMP52]|uniref:methyl-accepting chemotaxis protein n=1 Tax=Desulfosporosinus sp. HMP52 TaxID=1487923 RepID=UPI00051FDC81|nr:methyl-accepting chemotaxis protein [Desulfosporosinus sp. HMP52]KGK88691.1 chemotaxis protein [Desulfosporosinus sp. HMP52]
MKWFYNMKIAAKLISGFVFVALIAAVVGVVGIVNLKTIERADTELYENMTVPISQLAEISTEFQRARVHSRDIIISNDPVQMKNYADEFAARKATIDKDLISFEKTISSDSMRGLYDDLVKDNNSYFQEMNKVVELALQGRNVEAQALMVANSPAAIANKELQNAITSIIEAKLQDAKAKSDSNTQAANTATVTMSVVIVAGVLIAIGLGFFISSIISRPLKKLVEVANSLAEGDLNVSINVTTKDEVGMLMNSLSNLIVSLNEVMGEINNASSQVASGSRQVSASAQALSQGSTEQASSIEQLTASMEEISTQTRLNATNASQANELALSAQEEAVKGNEQMKGMLKAMDDINESSGNISKIIKVIDEIAFQTNILALNAAVEAARAGQHGKGFAVVAEEVRNLAARSANAAKETTALIEGSIKKVEGGTKIAKDTATALNQIVEGVTKAANLVGEIATASNEQALGINQVNQGIMQVSDVVQTNSATSEESAAASEELSSQAELLREQVNKFKLKKNTGSYNKGFDDLNPEVLRMLEDMSQKKKGSYSDMNQGYAEAAATGNKSRISLSDGEFGKY